MLTLYGEHCLCWAPAFVGPWAILLPSVQLVLSASNSRWAVLAVCWHCHCQSGCCHPPGCRCHPGSWHCHPCGCHRLPHHHPHHSLLLLHLRWFSSFAFICWLYCQ